MPARAISCAGDVPFRIVHKIVAMYSHDTHARLVEEACESQ